MTSSKTEDEPLFLDHDDLLVVPPNPILPDHHHLQSRVQAELSSLQVQIPIPIQIPVQNPPSSNGPSFSLHEMVLFRSSSSESPSRSSSTPESPIRSPTHRASTSTTSGITKNPTNPPLFISPEPHISSQFYTFNPASHALMIRCIIEHRTATSEEIQAATPFSVLKSWRAVWKDRNEETAYHTGWKRIQEKLTARVDENGNEFLCFKNNSQQFVSHINQWQDIVMSFHADGDMKHLGLRETIERIKQVWTVGAKFYGIPESYIRVCVAACPVCSSVASGSASKSKRRRFEYTESFDVSAKEVPQKLQELAQKHKVVLCIRQKYIRYKPFMAEVKDYACHRAGEPTSKKSKLLKREPYASKRCGCAFRIRAIVPITNYNEKDKTFVYQEEGMAIFKLYAVHSGHEPGPLDGNARIMHRVVGHKGRYIMEQDTIYGVNEDMENDNFGLICEDGGDSLRSVLQQVQELRAEVGTLEGKISKMPLELLGPVSQELSDIINKIRHLGEDSLRPVELLPGKSHADDILVGDNDLAHWSDHHEQMFVDGKDTEMIEDDEDSFERTLEDVVTWEQMRTECRTEKELMSESCKSDKWLKCSDFDDKSILDCGETKLTKPNRSDEAMVSDVSLGCLQVDSFYPENPKWYDSPCGLDNGADCGDSEFRHEGIL